MCSFRNRAVRLTLAGITTALALIVLPGTALAANVDVDVTITGTPGFNRTVQGAATIDINDGSTFRSITWRQTFGAPARLTALAGNKVRVKLGPEWKYRAELIKVLKEPPVTQEQLPPNVPIPEGEFPGGLQERFQLLGLNPFSLEEAGVVRIEAEVNTTSGLYYGEAEVSVHLPYASTTGLNNIPIDVPALLYSPSQASYNWTLTKPFASNAVLMAANSQTPYFVPDVPGTYEVRVNDLEADETVLLTIYAGTWRGVITGQDDDGRPVADTACTNCHEGLLERDEFENWAQTGHAEIFSSQLDTSTHYGPSCFSCHMVGYDPAADNMGADETSDYEDFLDSGLLNHPGDNWTQVLEQFPNLAMKANIQCENCHGPQVETADDTPAHGLNEPPGMPRVSLSSNVCAPCHGEPLRHARFQQWQLSGHANYELSIEEGNSGNCARCHTANGFLAWLPVLNGEVPGDPLANITVTWTEDDVHPQTCVTCHDPHANGSTTGVTTDSTVRIAGDTPRLASGFQAIGVGKGAICMTCHNTRRGIRNDGNFVLASAGQAPHSGTQADVLMGQNAYLVATGVRGAHSFVEDSCVNCHMERTPPPPDLSYNQSGTNHTFFARPDICTDCHTGLEVTNLQHAFEAIIHDLGEDIIAKILDVMSDSLDAGNTIDLGGLKTITDMSQIVSLTLSEASGQSAATIRLGNSSLITVQMRNIKVVPPPPGTPTAFLTVAGEGLAKAIWNHGLIEADGSKGVHNPSWVLQVLNASRVAVGGGGSGSPFLVLGNYPLKESAPK